MKQSSVSQNNAFLVNQDSAVCGIVTSTPTPPTPGQTERLRIVNGGNSQIFIFYQSPITALSDPNPVAISAGKYYDYRIPDAGLVSTRFWPGWGCSSDGKNCKIGAYYRCVSWWKILWW